MNHAPARARPFRTVLVPLDGSDLAARALDAAVALLAAGDDEGGAPATLHLVTVVEPVSFFLPGDPTLGVVPPSWFEDEGERVLASLKARRDELRAASPGLRIEVHAPAGRPAAEVLRLAESLAVDLIVMGSQGKGSVARAWLGSVADAVARGASSPVLLLPPGVPDPDLRSILVPLDGSAASDVALDVALGLAGVSGGTLNLVTVIPRPHSMAVPYVDLSAETERYRMTLEDAQRAHLEDRALALRDAGYRVETKTLRADEVAPGIVRMVTQMRAGIVVMGTAGRGGVSRMVLGSVATRTLRISTVPVLLVPPAYNREH